MKTEMNSGRAELNCHRGKQSAGGNEDTDGQSNWEEKENWHWLWMVVMVVGRKREVSELEKIEFQTGRTILLQMLFHPHWQKLWIKKQHSQPARMCEEIRFYAARRPTEDSNVLNACGTDFSFQPPSNLQRRYSARTIIYSVLALLRDGNPSPSPE